MPSRSLRFVGPCQVAAFKPQTHPPSRDKYGGRRPAWAGPLAGTNNGLVRNRLLGRAGHPLGKNPGDVWSIAKAQYRGAHFATFPAPLLTKPLLATCPERMCIRCGRPWLRQDADLRPDCRCAAGWQPGVVLDPFIGAGTVAIEAEHRGRDWLGVEINPAYRELALNRITSARSDREEVMPNHKKGVTHEPRTINTGAPRGTGAPRNEGDRR